MFAYYASFDVTDTRHGLGTLDISLPSYDVEFSVSLSTLRDAAVSGGRSISVFNHWAGLGHAQGEDRAGTEDVLGESYGALSFAEALQAHVRGTATSFGAPDPGDFDVEFDPVTLRYTLRGVSAQFHFSSPAGAALLGFGDGYYGTPGGDVGEHLPDFIVTPTQPDISTVGSSDALNYEPDGIANQAVSDSGMPYGISRTVAPLYRDWVQQYEPKAKCERLAALDAHPFTHQALVENCRTALPFVVVGGFASDTPEVFFLRAEGSSWNHDRIGDGNDVAFHVAYKTIVAGALVDVDEGGG